MKLNLSDTMNLSDFFMKRKNEKAQYNKCSKFYFEKKKMYTLISKLQV